MANDYDLGSVRQFIDLPSYRLRVLQDLSNAHQVQELASTGLKLREAQVIGALSHGPCSFREICERTQIDKATMSRLLQRLDADGFVERLPDPAHRRSFFAKLTPKGEAIREHLFAVAKARNERWLAALGPKQAGRFLDMLAVLERRLREMLTEDPQAPPPLPPSSVRRRSAAVDLALVERLHAALTQVIEDAGAD